MSEPFVTRACRVPFDLKRGFVYLWDSRRELVWVGGEKCHVKCPLAAIAVLRCQIMVIPPFIWAAVMVSVHRVLLGVLATSRLGEDARTKHLYLLKINCVNK